MKHLIQRYCFTTEKEKRASLRQAQPSREAKSDADQLKALVLKLDQALERLHATTAVSTRIHSLSHWRGRAVRVPRSTPP